MKALCLLACCLMVLSLAWAKDKPKRQAEVPKGSHLAEFHIVKVQEFTHDTTTPSIIGPRHRAEDYRVVAFSTAIPGLGQPVQSMKYVLACPKTAPEPGSIYWGGDTYVAPEYSYLHLWPAERRDVGLSGKGRVYRTVTLYLDPSDISKHVICDVYSAEVVPEGRAK